MPRTRRPRIRPHTPARRGDLHDLPAIVRELEIDCAGVFGDPQVHLLFVTLLGYRLDRRDRVSARLAVRRAVLAREELTNEPLTKVAPTHRPDCNVAVHVRNGCECVAVGPVEQLDVRLVDERGQDVGLGALGALAGWRQRRSERQQDNPANFPGGL